MLLVGGSTRIPMVRGLIAELTWIIEERDIRSDINPDEAISRGAALVARRHNPSDSFQGKEVDLVGAGVITIQEREEATALVLADVTSHTLGILTHKDGNPDHFHRLIAKESRIPAEKSEGGFTNMGPSHSVDVLIFQGEDDHAFRNTLIGKLPILLPEPKEGGYWKFEVTFRLDTNGLLHVSVKRLNDNQTFAMNVQCGVRSSGARISESATHLEQVMAGAPLPEIPEPPAPRAAAPAGNGGAPAAAAPATSGNGAPEEPPADIAPEFKSIARRSYKLLQQPMEPARRDQLYTAYAAFITSVKAGGGDVEGLGDALADAYMACKPS